MKKVLLIALLAVIASVTTAPFVASLGFGPATAYAQDVDDDNQFDEDDNSQ